METMSQFKNKEDLYKAIAKRMARALVDIMDGMPDHDIQAETGLDASHCEAIAEARADAKEFLRW